MSYIIYSLQEFENLFENNTLSNYSKTKKCNSKDINSKELNNILKSDNYDENIVFYKENDEIKYYFELEMNEIINNIYNLLEF